MSKLIDRLEALAQEASPPLGFGRAAQAPARSRMVLVARLTPASAGDAAELVAGADAALWHVPQGADIKSLRDRSAAVPGIPWGLWLPEGSRDEGGEISGAGFDFLVMPATASPAVPKDNDETGYVLHVDTTISDSLVRAIDNLPVDAVLVAFEPAPSFLAWRHLLIVQRFAAVVDRPLLVTLPENTVPGDLQMLWEAGVDGVVADTAPGAMETLRQKVAGLHEPPSRKRGRPGALLPRISAGASELAGEEEDEEDED